ncbi:MAG: chitobiase/beta-hexosaminidase C-terminal domain-containing protein [Prevotella sp.]|nr:chitobiase/beta-hexosaminidase C-terminal domain-containing protein [Prevotella sp.]
MKKKLRLMMTMLLLAVMGSAWADDYDVTYDYSALGNMLNGDYTDASSYWKVPGTAGNTATIAIPITNQPTSNITITFNIATFGSGTNPTSSNTTITAIGTETGSNWSGSSVSSYPSSSTYVNGVMTITKPDSPTSLGGLTITMGVNSGVKLFRLKSIRIQYTYATAPTPTYIVTLGDDNSTLTEETGGAGVTLPTRAALNGYDFAGWSETNVSEKTTTAPTIISAGAYTPTANITLYPVYTKTEDGGGTTHESASVTIADYATANNWGNGTKYTSVTLDENVTATTSDRTGTGNTGKYYTSGNDWRFYQNEDGKVIISTASGELTSVTFTFTVSNTGTLNYNSSAITSGTAVNVSGTSAEFTVGNSGSATNGQVRITAISVNYDVTNTGTTYYWSSPVAAAVETPVITIAENPFLFSTTATITCATDGATIKYSYDGENWSDYSSELTITETTTIYAKAIKGEDESDVAQVTATKNLAEPTVTIDDTGITNTNVFEGTAAGSLSATVTYNEAIIEGATVVWSGNNDEVANIDASTGAVTLVGAGTVTFTATFAGNDDYSEKTATYQMTVTNFDPNAPGTENNPYTVAQARAAIDAGTGITGVYATGIVTAIPTAWSSQYNNITFTFVDNSGDTDVLQAYRCVSTDNADASMVAVGDIVVVYGNLTNYQGTYEFYNPCQLVSLIHPSAVTFDPESSEQDGTYTVNITAESGTIYYIEQTKMIYLDLETGYPTETNTGVLNPAAVVYSGTLTYSQPMMVTAVAVDANGNISDATTAIYTYTGAVTPPYYETFSDYSGGFTAEKEANGPEWEIRSNTGQQAIANWGEERHYEYVSGSSANTYENNITRYYGTADLISPIINLIGVTDPSFFFIHAGHKFYSDPNTTAIKNTGLETTLDDEVAKYSCKVYVGISDANGNVTTWNQIPWGEGGATFFTQKFRANEYTNEDCTVTSSNDSRSGQFIRVNSGEISLDAYKNNYIRIKFEYTSDSEHYGTWNVDKFQVNASKTEKIEMNAKGWTTYVIDHDIDAYQTTLNIGGLQIFKVTEFDNTTAVLQQLGIVENHDSDVDDSERYLPAKTPIVVHGPAGQEIDFVIYQSPEVLPKVKNNLLYASLDPNLAKATSGVRYFVLQMKENADLPYFNKLKEGRAVPDHKAYLNGEQQVEAITSQTNAARGLFVMRDLTNGDSVVSEDGGFVDGIESIDEDTGNAVWHSISGVRVNHPTKGIYIVNGKKVIIK